MLLNGGKIEEGCLDTISQSTQIKIIEDKSYLSEDQTLDNVNNSPRRFINMNIDYMNENNRAIDMDSDQSEDELSLVIMRQYVIKYVNKDGKKPSNKTL